MEAFEFTLLIFFCCRLATVLKGKLTHEEVAVLKQGLVMSGRIDQAIGLLEELMKLAETEENQSAALALRDEIEKLRAEAQISGEAPLLLSEPEPDPGSDILVHEEEPPPMSGTIEDEEVDD
jgi:hypothetical protein